MLDMGGWVFAGFAFAAVLCTHVSGDPSPPHACRTAPTPRDPKRSSAAAIADRYSRRMRRILKWLLGLLVLNTLVWAVGQAITRSKTTSDVTADDVDFQAFWASPTFVPQSTSLRRVNVLVVMAGATVDLREAVPADGGTMAYVTTLLGGTAVLVRKDWDVEVVEETKSSEVDIRLDSGIERPSNSPKVTVYLRTTYGGALVGYEPSTKLGT